MHATHTPPPPPPPHTMTILDTIRAEGRRDNLSISDRIGFNYAISILGTYDDFKVGNIIIRRRQRGGEIVLYRTLLAKGHTLPEIKNIFKNWRRKSWSTAHGGVDPKHEDLVDEFNTFKTNAHAIKLPIFAGGRVTYVDLVNEGYTDVQIEEIFNTHRRKHTNMSVDSLRWNIYTEFMKIVANWKPSVYGSGGAASALRDDLEACSTTERPTTRTSFCSLVGRMMTLMRQCHRVTKKAQKKEQKKAMHALQETAWNKQSAKRELLKQKMGTAAFNAKKHRDKMASSIRKAAEVSSNLDRINAFLEYRRSIEGRSYDKKMVPAILSRPKNKYMPIHTKSKSLGFTNRATLATFVKNNISKLVNMKIRFDVDPCNIRTVLFQHVAVRRNFGVDVLPLTNTNDFDVKGQTFSITAWHIDAKGDVFVNLDNRRVTCHRKLPKEWAAFEEWSGYGIVGNPQVAVAMNTLIKIVPQNISFFSFTKDGDLYTIGHTNMVGMQKSIVELENGVKDKYVKAAEEARAAAAAAKEQRANAARAAERAKQDRIKYKIPKFPTMNETSNRKLKAMLAQQLANGSIDMETFKIGMAALG